MPPKAKAKSVYKMAEKLAEGTLVQDFTKQEWKVGPVIGKGGFGLIYLTQPASSSPVKSSAAYVMKMEPMENGPLFCEIACFQRAITQKLVSDYMKKEKKSFLGVPKFYVHGVYKQKSDSYRFMVMQRMGKDLEAIIASSHKHTLKPQFAFEVACQMIGALEYLHRQGYAHADIKASNIMTDYHNDKQMYLIDYGLAHRFSVSGKRAKYTEDKKMAHNGTCLFTSRDAHKGAHEEQCLTITEPSPRGDLEILGYCMWHWMEGHLPWEDLKDDVLKVAASKQSYMADVPDMIAPCISDSSASKILCLYMKTVNNLAYDEDPDYTSLIKILQTLIKSTKKTPKTPSALKSPKTPRSVQKDDDEVVLKPPPNKRSKKSPSGNSAKKNIRKVPRSRKVVMVSQEVQTSPGLQGLRSRKRKT